MNSQHTRKIIIVRCAMCGLQNPELDSIRNRQCRTGVFPACNTCINFQKIAAVAMGHHPQLLLAKASGLLLTSENKLNQENA